MNRGSTKIITGPMYSGKTSRVFAEIKKNIICGKRAVLIKHGLDNRYDTRGNLTKSHDGVQMNAIAAENLYEDPPGLSENVQVIGIDEGQFFEGILEFCERWNAKGVDIYIACLISDFEKKMWPLVNALICAYGIHEFMYAICISCKTTEAACTAHVGTQVPTETICIGADEKFVPTCNTCHTQEITPEMRTLRIKNVENFKIK